jgi:hypothetical protein
MQRNVRDVSVSQGSLKIVQETVGVSPVLAFARLMTVSLRDASSAGPLPSMMIRASARRAGSSNREGYVTAFPERSVVRTCM